LIARASASRGALPATIAPVARLATAIISWPCKSQARRQKFW
jgi:hypothetical protein